MELKKFITIFDNILPIDVLDKFTKVCQSFPYEEGRVGKGEIVKKLRDVGVCGLDPYSESMTRVHWFNIIKSMVGNIVNRYLQQHKVINIYTNGVESMQILKYEKNNHYAWHYDHAPNTPRTLSLIYLINDDYEGGELCFRNPDGTEEFKIPKKKNRVIIWPSCFLYPHSVAPIKNGERLSIVAWTT